MTNIGTKIASRRKELSMTQEELAKKMGYKSKSTINKIELGVNDIPQSKVVKFAKALDTTPGYLMGWHENEETSQKIDATTDILIRMEKDKIFSNLVQKIYTDNDFFESVKMLNELDEVKYSGVKAMLNSFSK